MANGAVLLYRMKRRSASCDRLPIDSRAAALAIAVASEAGQGQQPLAQQGRSAMTPPRPAAMDGAKGGDIPNNRACLLVISVRIKCGQGPLASTTWRASRGAPVASVWNVMAQMRVRSPVI